MKIFKSIWLVLTVAFKRRAIAKEIKEVVAVVEEAQEDKKWEKAEVLRVLTELLDVIYIVIPGVKEIRDALNEDQTTEG